MKYFKGVISSLLLLFIISHIVVSCGGSGSGNETSPAAVTSPSPSNPPVGTIDETSLYVRVYDKGDFKFDLQKRGSPKTECLIKKGDPNGIITCDLRINEMDLMFFPISIQANAPTGMCDFVGRLPYYYYNWEPGLSEGSVTIDLSATPTTCTVTAPMLLDSWNDPICKIKNSDNQETWSVASDGTVTSAFDYSLIGGPNCGEGDYNVNIKPKDINAETITYKGKFSGNYTSCLSGPAINALGWPRNPKGYPQVKVSNVTKQGFNELMEMKSILEIGKAATINVANGYNYQALFRGGAQVYTSLPLTIAPLSSSVTTNSGAKTPEPTSPYYFWYCYDSSKEVKYGIRLYIHEFNTTSEYDKWVASDHTTGSLTGPNPDITGNEGLISSDPCAYIQGEGFKCNDYYDWDNLTPSSPFPEE